MGDICRFWHLPSNGIIAKMALCVSLTDRVLRVLCMFCMSFEGKKCNICISMKWYELAQKCVRSIYAFRQLLSNDVISKIIFCDLDLHFEGKIFTIFISLKLQELSQKCVEEICRFLHLPSTWSNGVIAKILLHDHVFKGQILLFFLYLWHGYHKMCGSSVDF